MAQGKAVKPDILMICALRLPKMSEATSGAGHW